MDNIYNISADRKTLSPTIPGLPTIKLGAHLPVNFDVTKFVTELSRQISVSPTAKSFMTQVASEGIIFDAATAASAPRGVTADYVSRYAGFSFYPGFNRGSGTFQNGTPSFQIQAFIKFGDYSAAGLYDYVGLTAAFIHEGALHPALGLHANQNAAFDPVYSAQMQIQSDVGYRRQIGSSSIAYLRSHGAPSQISIKDFFVSVAGYKELLRNSGQEAQISQHPEFFNGQYSFVDSGARVWVVTDDAYLGASKAIQQYYLDKNKSFQSSHRILAVPRGDGVEGADYLEIIGDQIINVDGGQIGLALGTVLGRRVTSNPFGQVIGSAALSTILGAAGEFIDSQAFGGKSLSTAFFERDSNGTVVALNHGFDSVLLANIQGAGIGAISSYITAELVKAVGLNGIPAEVGNSAGGAVVNQVINNSLHLGETYQVIENGQVVTKTRQLFTDVGASLVVNAVGSYIGTKLASEIKSFGSVGGQIGAATGSITGGFTATAILASLNGVKLTAGATLSQVATTAAQFAAAQPVLAVAIVAAAVLVETLLGGLIGSVFGGTPRSGSDAQWDKSTQQFVVANIYAKKGGSRDAANQMASAVANNFNTVLSASGAVLANPLAVQSGNYGMRKTDYVYRPTSTTDKDAITARFSGNDGASKLIALGSYLGLQTMVGQLVGGNVYTKRALAKNLSNAGGVPGLGSASSAGVFDMTTLLGDLSVATDYQTYLTSSSAVDALIAANPNSSYAVTWLATLARATELALDRRAATDWTGGYSAFLDEVADGAIDDVSLSVSQIRAAIDPTNGARYWTITDPNGELLGYAGDTVAAGALTTITGTESGDQIKLEGERLLAASGGINVGLTVNGTAFSGQSRVINVTASIDAGGGDDRVDASDLGDNIAGGTGNDILYGGRLDDWLFGGDGNDILDAGAANTGALGGDGNYLDGGAGDDVLRGREGSDWLEGGDGADQLWGGAGDDILAGGVGTGDQLRGGAGGDQYLVRRGDGADFVEEEGSSVTAASQGGTGDAIAARMASIAAGRIKADWAGRSAGVSAGAVDGGDDAVVFGVGIEIGDIRLQRSADAGGPDLIITVMETGTDGIERDSGTRLTLRGWFTDSFKRVEWLKFADGTEIRLGDITSFIVGGAGNDVLIGTAGNDFVFGGAGNDKLFLMAGDDVGNGGTGNDMVSGGDDRDLVIGGLGDDDLLGGKGADALSGDAGADMLYGGADNDTLSGGRGDGDEVVGGAGDDRFKYSRGDGRDTIFDEFLASSWQTVLVGSTWAQGYTYNATTGEVTDSTGFKVRANIGTTAVPDFTWQGRFDYDPGTGTLKRFVAPTSGSMVVNSGTDTLEFAPGINIQDIILRRVGNDLVMAVADDDQDFANTAAVSDSITIKDWFVSGLAGQIERMAFYQTGILDTSAAKRALAGGTDVADVLVGTVMDDWITGGAGDDLISGGQGADILAGNAGSDTLRGEAGDDILYGGTGNDVLDGGAGSDVLIGGAGLDIASYASATAAVRAHLSAAWANAGDATGDQYDAIEGLTGGSGADVLGGDGGQNELSGGAGDDVLYGGAGDDTYVWTFSGTVGDGADTIYDAPFVVEEAVTTASALAAGYSVASWASTGVASLTPGQTYWRLQIRNAGGEIVYDYDRFSKAGSAPVVPTPTEYSTTGWKNGFARTNGYQVTRQKFDTAVDGGVDTLELGSGLSLSDLNFIWSGNDLIIRKDNNAATQMLIQGQKIALSRIETLQLADGQAVSLSNVLVGTGAGQLVGSAGDDLLVGLWGTTADNLAGGDGADVLVGYAGDDQLYGQNGDDVLEGGTGADRLDGGANSVVGSTTTAGDTARYARSAAGVTVDLTLAGAQGGGGDALGDILVGIENLVGSGFNDTLTGDAGGNRLVGLDGGDTLRGGGGDDVLIGDGGNDSLFGDDGVDALSGGDGDDQLRGGNGDDRLDGGDGVDDLYGEAGKDTLTGGAGGDLLDGGADDDTLSGDAGDDRMLGQDGNDILSGGLGNDLMWGGAGSDTYLFSATSGTDTVDDTAGANILAFDQSVSFDRLWMTRSGNDLRVGVIGGDATITVLGFFVGQATMRAIQTPTHAYYLDNANSLQLIAAMTAVSVGTPAAIPSAIADTLTTYWHAGGKAAPTAPSTPRALATNEDVPLAVSGDYGIVDHDGGPITYTLKSDRMPSRGVITGLNAATGAFTYTPNADVNGSDAFSLIATDADGLSVEIPVTVAIAPVNDAPRNLASTAALSVLESAPGSTTFNGTIIGQFTAVDIEGDAIIFSLANDAGGRFAINAAGQLRVLNATLLDREVAASHVIQVKATDIYGAATTTAFTVTVGNVNEAPNAPTITGVRYRVSEFVSGTTTVNNGTPVTNFSLSDPDGAPLPTLTFVADATGNPSNRFKIFNNYQVQFAFEPDFEALSALGFAITDANGNGLGDITLTGKVIANDGALLSITSTTFSVIVEDVNERQTSIALGAAASTIAERDRVATGTAKPAVILGTLSTIDPDLAGQLTGQQTYSVYEGSSTTVSTRFGVNASNQLTLLVNQSLDFETDGGSITLRVRATDKSASPLTFDQNFSFAIANVDDVVEGTTSNDVINGQQNRDILRGFAGNDTLNGLAGNDQLEGGDGDDTLSGGDGDDALLGQSGNDVLYGDAGNDTLSGGDGSDVLNGGAGNDTLNGDSGDDGVRAAGTDAWRGFTAAGLIGGDGTDILNGGDGDDYLDGGLGADQLNGGLGFDGVSYDASTSAVTINLAAGTGVGGSAQGDTLSGIELVQGSTYNDTLTGSSGADVLYGGAGNDVIKGGAGDDYLLGGAGDDTLDAEAGNDYLDGGLGNDILIGGADNDTYFVARNQGNDRIQNFDSTGTNFDHLTFDGSVLYTDIWFDRVDAAGVVSASGNHLKMTLLGAAGVEGSVTVENWFTIPDRTQPENYFKIDLISDGNDRAALPVNVDALVTLMASIPAGSRPMTQAQMASLRSGNVSFSNAMEDYWGRLSAPRISDTIALTGIEPRDSATTTVSFAVRAWFQDDQGLGVVIPASSIDLTLTATGSNVLSTFVSNVNYGVPDSAGNRTVTLTLAANASTHLLPGGVLPLQLQAKIRGTTRTALDPGGISLTINPTADTPTLIQLATTGGNAGTYIPLTITATSPDTDGSERVDVLIKDLPAGYSLTNASGVAVGHWDATYTLWRVFSFDVAGLRMFVPAGRYENATLQVQAQSVDGNSYRSGPWTPLTVVVNAPPTDITLSGSIAENAASGAFVGSLIGIDPDTAEGVAAPSSFQLLNNAGGRYVLDTANTSRLLVANGGDANFDFEAANRDAIHTITVRAFDSSGSYVDKSIVVPVLNINETPLAPSGTGWFFLDETGLGARPANGGQVVATFGLADPDGTIPTLQLANNPGNWFYIEGNQVKVVGNFDFNFEALRAAGYGIYDWNGDGRLDAHIGDVYVRASDGQYSSADTYNAFFISDVNERPDPLVNEATNIFQETTGGDTHSELLLTRFGMSDTDGNIDHLEIVGGNGNGWFRVNGNHIQISPGVNWTADWLRANRGQWGVDGDFYSDVNGNGLREIRVATLSVQSVDTQGARSDTYTYNVLIEDKNETPTFSQGSYDWSMPETAGWYTYLGAVAGSDIDGPASELRYNFSNWNRYWDGNLNRNVSLSYDGRFVMDDNGNVWTNGAQGFNWEGGQHDFSYQVMIYDKAWGANNTYSYSNVNVHLFDVDEQHGMHDKVVPWLENNWSTLAYGVSVIDMVDDPDPMGPNGSHPNIYYVFGDGSNDVGGWHLDQTSGILSFSPFDYEALTDVFEEQGYYDEWGNWQSSYVYAGQDPSRANMSLGIVARSRTPGIADRSATLTVQIQNDNEAPSISSYGLDSGRVLWRSPTEYWIKSDRRGGFIINLVAYDQEHDSNLSYEITDFSASEEIKYYGGSGEMDASGYPYVYINGWGQIGFDTPGGGNSEWEGGVTIGGLRRASVVRETFNVRVRDSGGATSITPFSLTFLSRGTSAPPVVLDLDGDGIELTSYEDAAVSFDMDKDGIRDLTGWVGPDDGLLALDRNNNGTIDDINEISFIGDDPQALSDIEGLRAFDSNGNGFLDEGDQRFGEFLVWQDVNHDGISQTGELKSLADRGIKNIGLTITRNPDDTETGGNRIFATSSFARADGTVGTAGDVLLSFDASNIEALAAPIILDLDGDGKTIVPLADSATTFDMVGDGKLRRTAWLDAGDAFLVRDRNGNGLVDDIRDISFVGDKPGAQTDLEGLAAFDDNGDGLLDARDASFVGFNVWRDANANGTTDAGELLTLAQVGISSISLTGKSTGETVAGRAMGQSVTFNTAGFTYADGKAGILSDVALAYSTVPVGKAGVANVKFQSITVNPVRSSGKFRLRASGGSITLRPLDTSGVIDAGAGKVGPATLLTFANESVGLLNSLILDLDGEGLTLQSRKKSRAVFDMDNDGVADDTGWIDKSEGFLVIDRDGDGRISSAAELSFFAEKEGLSSSFAELALLDANKDGKIDKSDARFGELKVWRDINRNGQTDDGELTTLTESGVASLSLSTSALTASAKPGDNLGLSTAIFTRTDGSTATMGEAALAFRPSSREGKPGDTVDSLTSPTAAASTAFEDHVSKSEVSPSQAADRSLAALSWGSLSSLLAFDQPDSAGVLETGAAVGVQDDDALSPQGNTLSALIPRLAAAQMTDAIGGFGVETATDGRWTPFNEARSPLLALAAAR